MAASTAEREVPARSCHAGRRFLPLVTLIAAASPQLSGDAIRARVEAADAGRTIAFRRTSAHRKAKCLDAVTPPIFVTSVRTFDERGATLSRTDDVRDALGVELHASDCTLPAAAPCAIRPSAGELGEAELWDGVR